MGKEDAKGGTLHIMGTIAADAAGHRSVLDYHRHGFKQQSGLETVGGDYRISRWWRCCNHIERLIWSVLDYNYWSAHKSRIRNV